MNLTDVIQEMAIESRPLTDSEICEGQPATYFIGSDSYAQTVDKVTRFKSGARAGQIREIESGGDRFRPRHGRFRLVDRFDGRTLDYGQLVVGFAKDYRDPSF